MSDIAISEDQPNPVPTGVVVVGAGVSGLRCACQLVNAGLEVVVLEARQRIGGRLLSEPVEGGHVDLGASWFWPNEPLVNAVVSSANLNPFAQHLDGDALFQTADGVQRMQGNQLDVPSGRLPRGTHSIAQALADRLEPDAVRVGHSVDAIEPERSGVSVRSGSRVFAAQSVVVALPPALAVHGIDFGEHLDPALTRLAGQVPVWMGGTIKAVATFERPFWRDQGLAGSAFSYVGPLGELHDMSGPDGAPAAIFGFGRPRAGEPAPTAEAVVDQLVTLFGPDAAHPNDVLIQDWRQESYTSPPNVTDLGSYQLFGHAAFAKPAMNGRLHWCSTETSPAAPGHIEGALHAADRAAAAVIASHQKDRP